jgi:single-strand DNA-binding protein
MSATNMNRVVLTGHLTRDPALSLLPSGSSVCNMRVAVNSRWRNPSTGDWDDKPNFFRVVVFGGQGENVAKHMQKGSSIAIDGRLDWREWETRDGRRAQAVSVIADTVQFIGPPRSEVRGAGEGAEEEALQGLASEQRQALDILAEETLTDLALDGHEE